MEITDKDVLEKFISKDRVNSARAAKKHIEKNYPEYCVYLKNRFSEDEFISYAKTIRRIYDNVEVLPVCQNCGKKLLDYTHKWCSTSCQLSDRKFIEKRVEESRPFLKERAQKGKRTCLERYGVECIFNRSEVREKTKKGVVSEEAKQKRKQTNLEKYGSENVFACKDIREKIKETNIKKYGVSVPIQNQEIKEKIIKTNQDKFGSDFYLGTKQCIEKTREFNQNKYGVD